VKTKSPYSQVKNSLNTKLIGFFVALFLIAMISVASVSYFIAKDSLNQKGEIILANGVRQAMTYIEDKYGEVQMGYITREEAEEQIKRNLLGPMMEDGTRQLHHNIDLGAHGYFIIYDLDGNEVMHPTLEGQNVWDVVDFGDKEHFVVREQINAAVSGGGYTYYEWLFPHSNRTGRKISYVEYEPNWGWVLAATAYERDFNSAANTILAVIIGTMAGLLLLLTYVSIKFVSGTTRPLYEVYKGMMDVEKGYYHKVDPVHSNDEIEFLVKGYNNMVHSIELARENLNLQNDRLTYLAYNDTLTDLPNRNAFKDNVSKTLSRGVTRGYLVQMDIHDFKTINSIFGYELGNGLLKRIGVHLQKPKYEEMVLARTSGNEFSMWVHGRNRAEVYELLKEIHYDLNQIDILQEVNQSIELHFAFARYPDHGNDFESLYEKASIAMKFAKEQGDTKPHGYTEEMEQSILHERDMRIQLEAAIDNGEIYPAYQAQKNYKTDKVVGVEGLARWHSTKLGQVSPGVFVPAVHNFFLDEKFGQYMVDRILGDYKALQSKYGMDITVSINISPIYFTSESFVAYTQKKLDQYGVPPEKVIYEITEDLLLDNFELVREVVEQIRGIGIKLSIDDFGTGYSSMSYLAMIPLDEMKIDKSFVDRLTDGPQAVKLFKTLCSVAEVFGYTLIAEGVESYEQLEIISDTSLEIIQGYLYSKPEKL